MKRLSTSVVLLALVYVLSAAGHRNVAQGQDAPPATQPSDNGGGPGGGGPGGGGPGGGGPGGGGGRPNGPPGGFHLIPRFAMAKLNLTDDQKAAIAALEKDTKAKLAAILTPEQMKTLETARPPMMGRRGGGQNGGGGQGGPSGGPGGGPGGGQGQDGPLDGPPGGAPGGPGQGGAASN